VGIAEEAASSFFFLLLVFGSNFFSIFLSVLADSQSRTMMACLSRNRMEMNGLSRVKGKVRKEEPGIYSLRIVGRICRGISALVKEKKKSIFKCRYLKHRIVTFWKAAILSAVPAQNIYLRQKLTELAYKRILYVAGMLD
jgi:hypothetical protein